MLPLPRLNQFSCLVLASLTSGLALAQVSLDAIPVDQPLIDSCNPAKLTRVVGTNGPVWYNWRAESVPQPSGTAISTIGNVQNGQFTRTNVFAFDNQEHQFLASHPDAPGVLFAAYRRRIGVTSTPYIEAFDAETMLPLLTQQIDLFDSSPNTFTISDVANNTQFRATFAGFANATSFVAGASTPSWAVATSNQTNVLAATQLDADPQHELLVASSTNLAVIDGSNGFVQGSIAEPSVQRGELANFDNDANLELIVRTRNSHLAVYDLPSLSELWRYDADFVRDFALYDRDQDGKTDVVLLDTQNRGRWLQPDGTPETAIPIDLPLPAQIDVVELAGGPPAEFLIRDSNCTGYFAYTLDFASNIASKYRDTGPFDNVKIADLDQDGDLESVSLNIANTGSPTQYRLRVVDVTSGRELMRGGANGLAIAEGQLLDISILQFDTDPQFEIMVGNRDFVENVDQVLIFDGQNLNVQDALNLPTGAPNGRLEAVRLGDFDADGEFEWMLLTNISTGLRLRLLRQSDLTVEWDSAVIFGTAKSLLSNGQFDGDSAQEAVLLLDTGAIVFDLATHLVQATASGSFVDADATRVGATPALALLAGDRIDLISTGTGQLLAQIPLSTPANALALSDLDPGLAFLAAKNRFQAVRWPSGEVISESRFVGSQLGEFGAIHLKEQAGTISAYAGNRYAVWRATLTETPLLKDGFE